MAIDFADLAVRVNYGDVDKAAQALERLKTASAGAESSTNRVGVSSVAATRNMGAWAAIQAEATGRVGEHSLAIGRLGSRLESMTADALGANSAVGLLGASFLKFGVGDVYTVAILGGLYAVVKVYDLLTDGARKAKDQMDEMTDTLVKQARAANAATVQGSADLSLIAGVNAQTIGKESGIGWRSVLNSILTGVPMLSATDADAQAGRVTNALTGDKQANVNEYDVLSGDARKRVEEAAKADAAFQKEIDTLAKGLVFQDQRKRVTGELIGIEHQLESQVNSGTLSLEKRTIALERLGVVMDALSRKFIVAGNITNAGQLIGITGDGETGAARFDKAYGGAVANVGSGRVIPLNSGPVGEQQKDYLDSALYKHEEAVRKATQAYEAALAPFKSVSNAVTDFGEGLKAAKTGILEHFSPSGIVQSLSGGLISMVDHAVGSVLGTAIGGVRHAFFGQDGQERDATRQAAASAHAMALQLDEVTKALSGDQLGAAIDALKIGLIQGLQAINAAMPGTRNEAERNAARDLATRQEAEQEARTRRQFAEQQQYASEDLVVRNLRATGRGDQADLLAFQEKQAREYQAALDANKDASYLLALRITENNELTAFQNGLLQDAFRNVPTGFFANAYYSEFATPRGSGYETDSGIVSTKLQGGLPAAGAPPRGVSTGPTTLNVSFTIDGSKSATETTKLVVDKLNQVARSVGGGSVSLSDALERLR